MKSIHILEGPRKTGKTTYLSDNGFPCFKEIGFYLANEIIDPKDRGSYFQGKDATLFQMMRYLSKKEEDVIYVDRFFVSSIVYSSIHYGLDFEKEIEKTIRLIEMFQIGEISDVILMNHTEESIEKALTCSRDRGEIERSQFDDSRRSLRQEMDLFELSKERLLDFIEIQVITPYIVSDRIEPYV